MSTIVAYVAARAPELWMRTLEHLVLTGASTLAATALGVPLGIIAFRSPRGKTALVAAVSLLQTIPSLAMLALLLVLFGRIGAAPALAALTLYALLPVVRNTLVGLEGVPAEIAEAARGLGMTQWQELVRVRAPLALPVAMAGVRTAAVIGVGIATLSAFIGAGGLGQFINRGLALSDTRLILLGAVPAGLLALLVDGSLAGLEWASDGRRHRHAHGPSRRVLRAAAAALPLVLLLAPLSRLAAARRGLAPSATVSICTKNFTEQLVLGELMAQLIEGRTSLDVERRFNLGGTIICHEALVNGEVDLYAEYTGTALTAILGSGQAASASASAVEASAPRGAQAVLESVRAAYVDLFDVSWLSTFGFDNTYVLLADPAMADSLGLRMVSDVADVAHRLTVGFTAEFAARPDGYRGFTRHYGFSFGATRDLDPGLLYRAVAGGEVEVAFGFATDGRIDAYGLRVLEDDRSFFPPYEAAPVVRTAALEAHPDLEPTLELLAGQLPDSTMRRLNREAEEGTAVASVARAFLESRSLLTAKLRPEQNGQEPEAP